MLSRFKTIAFMQQSFRQERHDEQFTFMPESLHHEFLQRIFDPPAEWQSTAHGPPSCDMALHHKHLRTVNQADTVLDTTTQYQQVGLDSAIKRNDSLYLCLPSAMIRLQVLLTCCPSSQKVHQACPCWQRSQATTS